MPNGALYLLRHGSTSHNFHPAGERLRGRLNIDLAASGIVAARRAARFLEPYQPTHLFTSDLPRAQQTAKIMSPVLQLTVEPRRDLGPWDVGVFAGQAVSVVKDELAAYMNGRSTEAVPGGESFRTFLQRWKGELLRLLTLMRKLEEPIVAVTHARNLYALQSLIFGEDIPVKGPPNPGAVVRLAGERGSVTVATIFAGEAQGGMSG